MNYALSTKRPRLSQTSAEICQKFWLSSQFRHFEVEGARHVASEMTAIFWLERNPARAGGVERAVLVVRMPVFTTELDRYDYVL